MGIEQRTGLNELKHNQQDVKPLTPNQHGIIANMRKGTFSRAIMDTLVAARSGGKKVSKEDLLDLYGSFYQSPPPDNKMSNQDYEEEKRRLRMHIKHLKDTLEKENSGLVILSLSRYDKANKKFETFYVLKTKEEMEKDSLESVGLNQALLDQDGNKELYTIKDLQEATGLDIKTIRSRLYMLRKKDPTIKIERMGGGPPSTKIIVMDGETFEKLKATIKPREKKQPDTENQELASQEKTLQTKKVGPFDDEYEKRAMIGKTKEQIREDTKIYSATVILSHLASGVMEDLTKDPRELLENLLPRDNHIIKTKLTSVISEPPKQFVVYSLTKVLEAFWNKDPIHASSVNEGRILDYCFELSKKGYSMERIVEIAHRHFSGADSATYAAAHQYQEGSIHF